MRGGLGRGCARDNVGVLGWELPQRCLGLPNLTILLSTRLCTSSRTENQPRERFSHWATCNQPGSRYRRAHAAHTPSELPSDTARRQQLAWHKLCSKSRITICCGWLALLLNRITQKAKAWRPGLSWRGFALFRDSSVLYTQLCHSQPQATAVKWWWQRSDKGVSLPPTDRDMEHAVGTQICSNKSTSGHSLQPLLSVCA